MSWRTDRWTLTQAARILDEPQHRLIYLCEQGVVRPDHQDARGRGSSRLFSSRNLLEFAVALQLRQLPLPVSSLAVFVYALRAFERAVRVERPQFRLPNGLQGESAPDVRIVIGDGRFLYLLFRWGFGPASVFGGVDLQRLRSGRLTPDDLERVGQSMEVLGEEDVSSRGWADFGAPEGSRYWRVEVAVTRVAWDLLSRE